MSKIKCLLLMLVIGSSTSAFATSFNCTLSDAEDHSGDGIQVTYTKNVIQSLTANGISFVQNSKAISAGDGMCFNQVAKLTTSAGGTKRISLSYQCYSDVSTYEFTLSEGSNEAALVSTYESSDGDSLVHVSAKNLTCK